MHLHLHALFFNRPRIFREVQIFALEHTKMKSKGRTARTTASTTAYEYREVCQGESAT